MSPVNFLALYWQAQSDHDLTREYAKNQLRRHFPEKKDAIDFCKKHGLDHLLNKQQTKGDL